MAGGFIVIVVLAELFAALIIAPLWGQSMRLEPDRQRPEDRRARLRSISRDQAAALVAITIWMLIVSYPTVALLHITDLMNHRSFFSGWLMPMAVIALASLVTGFIISRHSTLPHVVLTYLLAGLALAVALFLGGSTGPYSAKTLWILGALTILAPPVIYDAALVVALLRRHARSRRSPT